MTLANFLMIVLLFIATYCGTTWGFGMIQLFRARRANILTEQQDSTANQALANLGICCSIALGAAGIISAL